MAIDQNQNIDFASNLIASGPVDFVEPLAQFYAADKKTRAEHGARLEKQDAQRTAAAKLTSLKGVLKDVATFSTSARKLVASVQKQNAANELTDKKEGQAAWKILGTNFASEYSYKNYLEHKKLTTELSKDENLSLKSISENLTKQAKNGDPMSAWALRELNNQKGSALIYSKEIQARALSKRLTPIHYRDTLGLEEGKIYDAAEHGNPQLRHQMYINWLQKELSFLDLSPQTFAAILGPETSRLRTTHKGVEQANQFKLITTRDHTEFLAAVQGTTNSGSFSQSVVSYAEKITSDNVYVDESKTGGLTVRRQVGDDLFNKLGPLALDEDITTDAMTELVTTPVYHKGEKRWVTFGELYFGEEKTKILLDKTKVGAKRRVHVLKARAKIRIPELKIEAENGKNVTEEAQKLLDKYPEYREQIEDILDTKPGLQTSGAFTTADAKYQKQFTDGTISVEDLKNEPNREAREKWTPIAKNLVRFKKMQNWEGVQKANEDLVVNLIRKKSLIPGQKPSQNELTAINLLNHTAQNLLSQKLLNQEVSGKSDTQIFIEVQQELDAWRLRNGWGTKEGLFGVDQGNILPFTQAKFVNLSKTLYNIEDAQIDYNVGDKNLVANYEDSVKVEPDAQTRVNKGIYTREMVLGFQQNGYFSNDMKWLAAKNGTLPGKAYEATLKAIETQEGGKEWLVANNFERTGKEEQIEDNLIEALIKEADAAKGTSREASINQIRSILRWYGWDHLDENQRTDVYEILQKVSPVDSTKNITSLEAQLQKLRVEGKTEKEINQILEKYKNKKALKEGGVPLYEGDFPTVNPNMVS